MAKALQLVNGVARMVSQDDLYEQTIVVSGTTSSGTAVTLPSSATYTSDELQVYVNNILQETVLDYNYVGGSPPRTQVTFTFDLIDGDRVRFKKIIKK